jgi:hypothetical protein
MNTGWKSKQGTARRFSDPRVIELRPRPRPSGKTRAPIIDPLRQHEIDDDRRRMQQNLAAAIVVILLTAAGVWVIEELRTSARILACVEAGHYNCVPIDRDGARQR